MCTFLSRRLRESLRPSRTAHLDLHGLAAGPHELGNLDGVAVDEVVRLPEVLDGDRRPARTGVDPHSNTHPECEHVGYKIEGKYVILLGKNL